MPHALLWTPLAIGFTNKDASILLETIKPSKVTKSELVPCTVCTVAEPHNMRYRLRRCSCRSCTEEAPYAKCPWRAKTLHCEQVDHVDIYETSKHVTAMRAAPEPRLTSEMKVVAREMTAQGLKPVRIRNAILRKFNLAAEELPALSKIQRFCQHYASTKLGCNDYVKETHDLIRDAGYVGTMDEHESFTFALNSDAVGLPAVGIGSDAKPFIVGVTSRRLLMQADREAGSLLLHVDATFKLNQVGYPSIVVGFSDCARRFHLLALFVSSQRKQEHFTEMFAALQQIYKRVIGKQLLIKMVMGDADDAQFNGVERVFGESAEVKYLMCFYHVVAKVFEKTRALQPSHAKLVMTGVYDMHFSLSETEFLTTKARVLGEWAEVPELATFVTYFKAQWLAGRYTHWQVYHTPRGWATTNNPVEQYNRTIKRQYTLHTRLKMGALLGQFLTCCTSESLSDKPFATEATIPKSLVRRNKELAAAKLLHEYSPGRSSIAFLLGEDADTRPPADCVRVVSKPCPRIFDPEVGRTHEAIMVTAQQGVQLARMEVEGMPSTGWTVNTSSRSCSCRFFQKYAACIHLTHALSIRGLLGRGKRPTLVYRGSNKARRMQSETQAPGRPAQNGYALDKK